MKKLALLFFLAASAAVRVNALTLAEIRVEVRRYSNDVVDPRVKHSDAMITRLVNEAQREVVNQTWCLTNRSTQTLTAATTYYNLPNDLIAIEHVEFRDTSSRTRELLEVSEKATQQSNPDYERQAGAPFQYFVRSTTFTTGTPLQIAVIPVPSSSTSAGLLTIDYYSQATSLSADTDVPFDGQRVLYPYHYALVYSAVAKLKLIDGDTTGAAAYLQMAQAYYALMLDRLGRMPNYNPGFGSATK